MKGLTRIFNGKKYKLMTNKRGITSDAAIHIKNDLKRKGYNIRVICDITHPEIYPEGRYFVYASKLK